MSGPARVDVLPYWRVLSAQAEPEPRTSSNDVPVIRLAPSAAFGDGTHETTQLCLLGLGSLLRTGFRPASALDFGSGSGILSIAVARFGARVEAVEIDEQAILSAHRNAEMNDVSKQIEFRHRLSQPAQSFDLVMANVVLSVLLDFADALCARISQGGRMLLSGLVATDVPVVFARYRPLLGPWQADVHTRGEWRVVQFRR